MTAAEEQAVLLAAGVVIGSAISAAVFIATEFVRERRRSHAHKSLVETLSEKADKKHGP